ncbi:hypothetical protein LU692_25050, partial [Pseudomonas sp. NMI795_08]|nr:hypothetical protein [Pseudomonas sp. NMI795_08]
CRSNWPETDVGAGLPAMRRAGGARSQERCKNTGEHLVAVMRSSARPSQPQAFLRLARTPYDISETETKSYSSA